MMRRQISKCFIKTASILCATSVLLGGCGLFSEEEENRSISIVRESMENEFDIVHCEKRDVIKTGSVSCSYKQLMEENLAFPVSDKTISFIYVNEGDEVKVGDLLAKLDVAQLEKDNIEMREQLEKNEFLIGQADEKIEFYEKRLESSGISLSAKESYLSKLQSLREKRRDYNDENEFNRIKISANEQQIEAGSLYAGMDGNISYIKNNVEGSTSVAGEKVITILNSSVIGFQGQDKNALAFIKEGDKVVINCSTIGQSYDATVTSVDAESAKMVFELDEPDYSIAVGTRGMITVVQEEAKGALSLPKSCVFETEDFTYVYILNEDGVREMRKITAGVIGDEFVEIVDGISETESVILRKS